MPLIIDVIFRQYQHLNEITKDKSIRTANTRTFWTKILTNVILIILDTRRTTCRNGKKQYNVRKQSKFSLFKSRAENQKKDQTHGF